MQVGTLVKHKVTGQLGYIKRIRPGVNRIQVRGATNLDNRIHYWRLSVIERFMLNDTAQLNTLQAKVYNLYLQGMSNADIANTLEVAQSTVRGRLSEAKRIMEQSAQAV